MNRNVDSSRTCRNYNPITAGLPCPIDEEMVQCLDDYWKSYQILNDMYWAERKAAKVIQDEAYQQFLTKMRRYRQSQQAFDNNPLITFFAFLIFPLLIPCEIYLQYQFHKEREALEALKDEQWIRDMTYKASKRALRDALKERDLQSASTYLKIFDSAVTEMAKCANDYAHIKPEIDLTVPRERRFATIEEIYEKVYEPSFREFQANQRPCRRYNGTYLEYIREGRAKGNAKKQQTRNAKNRSTAEAIEFVIGIGDMDNTGYEAAFEDAKKSETLLKDFCDHLMTQHNVCFVTTAELNDPNWQPPFRHGLILLNLTLHADEATPGIHLTCIPYSRGCKRGPAVQASLGRALTGMGYPSTWKDVLNESGERVPKRNRNNEIIHNKDGTVRYQQEPDKQGIIDWIEVQKRWIQSEMKKRYNWEREYKGSHPRGNLDTPDYKAAQAKERAEEYNQIIRNSLDSYQEHVYKLSLHLDDKVSSQWQTAKNQDIINRYLAVCTDEEYDAVVAKAAEYLDKLAFKEQEKAHRALKQQIQQAADRQQTGSYKSERNTQHR